MERTPETKVLFHNHRRKKNNNGKTPKRKLAGAQLSDKKPGEISKRPDEEFRWGFTGTHAAAGGSEDK